MAETFYLSKTENEKRNHIVKIEGRKIRSRIEYSNQNKAPDNLFKYYKCNEFSLNVLKESKIWASNPSSFNDPFDCTPLFWEGKSFPYSDIKEYIKNLNIIEPKQVNSCQNVNQLRELFFNVIKDIIGIFCLNEKIDNDPFWAYYGDDHKGFCINFKTNELRKYWKAEPLKIEYLELENLLKNRLPLKIDDLHDKKILPKLVRWITVKKKNWIHESEWRYLFWVDRRDQISRKQQFPKKAIESIILGYKFFDGSEAKYLQNGIYKHTFALSDVNSQPIVNSNYEILKFLKDSFNKPLYQIALNENLELYHQRIFIKEINENLVVVDRNFSREQIDMMDAKVE